jgi:GNAT superfamily N-acetyltransferase
VTRGTVRQVLVYDRDRCVGWCQFGSPPELPNINNRRTYDQGAGDPPDWRIGCIFTNAKDRGKGVAAAAVAAALEEIKRAGGGVVEAYPEQTGQRPPQRGAYLHTGPEELYAHYGFTRVRKIAKWRWVMRSCSTTRCGWHPSPGWPSSSPGRCRNTACSSPRLPPPSPASKSPSTERVPAAESQTPPASWPRR